MASGSVPIGAAGGAGREFMVHGLNSLIVDDGDWEALAEEVENVYGNEQKLNQLRTAGLETAKRFTPEKQKITVSELLPFANTIVPFSFDKTGLFTTKHGTITALIGGTEIKETVSVVPFYLIVLEKPYITWLIGGGVVVASIALIIFILTRRSRNLPVS
jgi:hypothetical protein